MMAELILAARTRATGVIPRKSTVLIPTPCLTFSAEPTVAEPS